MVHFYITMESQISIGKIDLTHNLAIDLTQVEQGIQTNNNHKKNLKTMTTEVLSSSVQLEITRKTVSWAEDKVLVEMHEIESNRRASLCCRILERMCCKCRSPEK